VQSPAAKFFAKRLRELRKQRSWTQEQAAENCGVGYKLYQLYELGIKNNPGLLTLEKIANGYGIELRQLFRSTPPKARRLK
jgi:transcriptional regulator with XRE-family HTH domain